MRIGVVLVNWNGAKDTLVALDSIARCDPPPARVVVVDNGSVDDSRARIGEWIEMHPSARATLIPLAENRGFPGGNNAGVAALFEDYTVDAVLLLNNDTEVATDFFAELANGAAARPDGSLYGCTIYEWDRTTVWYAGGHEIPLRALVVHDYTVPASESPVDTDFVTGCAMLIPRRTYESVGGLGECYFPLYWEDAEYSHRARRRVGPLVYVPAAMVYHRVGATVGAAEETPRVSYVQNHHRALYVRRNYSGLARAIALAYLGVTKPAKALREYLRGNRAVGSAVLRGMLAGLSVSTRDVSAADAPLR